MAADVRKPSRPKTENEQGVVQNTKVAPRQPVVLRKASGTLIVGTLFVFVRLRVTSAGLSRSGIQLIRRNRACPLTSDTPQRLLVRRKLKRKEVGVWGRRPGLPVPPPGGSTRTQPVTFAGAANDGRSRSPDEQPILMRG